MTITGGNNILPKVFSKHIRRYWAILKILDLSAIWALVCPQSDSGHISLHTRKSELH
jgi:hypothetical protein